MISLDGVMQAPGGPDEDTSGDFQYGGWVDPYFDELYNQILEKQLKPADLLLGRRTFEIFADYWPKHEEGWPGVNDITKYVLSGSMEKLDWKNSIFLRNLNNIKSQKNSTGSDLQIHGSSQLINLLLKHDLIDELWLKIHPLILATGKRLFDNNAIPAAYTLLESSITPGGAIMANYKQAGEVKTGTVGT